MLNLTPNQRATNIAIDRENAEAAKRTSTAAGYNFPWVEAYNTGLDECGCHIYVRLTEADVLEYRTLHYGWCYRV